MKHVFIRTQYNYDTEAVSKETGLACLDASMTQQQFKEETDINFIVNRFGVTGQLPITAVQPMQGDFTNIEDFRTAMNAVQEAQANFMRLPSAVREKFRHNPQLFVDFCTDPANIDAVREMGLAPKKPEPPKEPTA